MAQTAWINGLTKDIQEFNGLIVQNTPCLTEAYSRIVTPLGSYLVDQTWGSRLYSLFNTRQVPTVNTVIETINDALLPMKNLQRVQTFATKVIYPPTTTSVTFSVLLTTLDGTSFELNDTYRR